MISIINVRFSIWFLLRLVSQISIIFKLFEYQNINFTNFRSNEDDKDRYITASNIYRLEYKSQACSFILFNNKYNIDINRDDFTAPLNY